MRPSYSRFLAAGTLALLVLTGQGCGGPSKAQQEAVTPAKLVIWNVFDGEDALRPAMAKYQALHPNVSFDYRQLRVDEYKNELVRAFAEGRGPDLFFVHNTWIGEELPLMAPMPKTLSIPYVEVTGTIKKEKVYSIKTEPTISLRQLKNDFLDVVTGDVVRPYQATPKDTPEQRIWGLPLAVDSLALYYNKDLLNTAGISAPPATWEDFQADVPKLTSVGPNDQIVQSGAAMGTSRNVERAFDLLSVIMMQNGTQMVDDNGRAAFAGANADREVPGLQALTFYTDFANPTKATYAWNRQQPASFDAFASGKTAFFFGYSYHAPLLRARNPKLKFAIAPLPQIGGGRPVNYANYWVASVAKSSKNQTWGWDFIQFAAKADNVKDYLKATAKPPARRALIAGLSEDEDLAPFAGQLLTATSWYKGTNVAVAEQALLDLIDVANAGGEIEQEISRTQNKVNQSL